MRDDVSGELSELIEVQHKNLQSCNAADRSDLRCGREPIPRCIAEVHGMSGKAIASEPHRMGVDGGM